MSWFRRPKPEAETSPAPSPAPAEPPANGETGRQGLFARFKERLTKTRNDLKSRLEDVFTSRAQVDEALLDELEEALITADLGVAAAARLLEDLRRKIKQRSLTDPAQVKEALKESLLEILRQVEATPAKPVSGPEVILVVGVNGVGKTTTVGKLARRYLQEGRKVLLAAGDTFRAAAGEQLEVWAERAGAEIVRHQSGADPSAVVFDALDAALARGIEVVLVDTAGRLHTKTNLMEELKKIRRTMDRKIPGAPHQTILVLDATTGQNALSQAKLFHEATPLTGLIMTKLDGTAKGGILLAVASLLSRPILYVGLGEQMNDLKPFDAEAFVEAVL
jgi:fused signal recognition particle receptor